MIHSKTSYSDFGLNVDLGGPEEQHLSCPECSSKRRKKAAKCLSVNIQKECWVCHHCGWTGTLKKGAKFSDPHYQKPEYTKPKLLPSNPELVPKIIQWFIKRGITTDTQIRNKLTVSEVWMPQIEGFTQAIGFPYYRNGEHINTKWRDSKKHFRLEAGAELILYGLDDIKEADTIIWVEGEMDKLSVEEAGFKNCVSVPNGAPPPDSKNYSAKFDFLRTAEEFISGKSHILFLDSDEAGKKLEEELSRRLGKENCKRVRLPDEYKDANEYLIAHGSEALRDAVLDAKPFPVSGIYEGKSITGSVLNLKKDGIQRGCKTGWVEVDGYFSVKPGQMTIVTGIPNHGKSNWLDCLTLNIAQKYGWRFGIFSPENQPLERHAAGLIEKFNKKPFNKLGDDYVETTMEWLDRHYYWILPDLDDDWSLVGILDKAKALVYRHGINGLIIDPWNEIEHRRPVNMSETDYISASLTKIRQFARLHNVHVWIVAHPSKLRKDLQTKEYPIPTPYDISGSAHWRNKADNCITVFRHFTGQREGEVDICIQKIRFSEVGKVGAAPLVYDPDMCNYRSKSHFDTRETT